MQSKFEEATKQSLQQGLQKGINQEKLTIAKKMKDMGLDLQTISEVTSLTIEEIDKL